MSEGTGGKVLSETQPSNFFPSSNLRDLEARYTALLEERIVALEEQLGKQAQTQIPFINDEYSYRAENGSETAIPDRNGARASGEDIDDGDRDGTTEDKGTVNNEATDQENGSETKINEQKDGIGAENSSSASKNEEPYQNSDSKSSSRIRYRETRYNKEGLPEEKDARESTPPDESGTAREDTKEHAFDVIRRYKADDKYESLALRLEDPNLITLVLFCFADDPEYKHVTHTRPIYERSPFLTYIWNWDNLNYLSALNETQDIVIELRKTLSERKNSRNLGQERSHPQLLDGIEAFLDEDKLKAAARDLGMLLDVIRSSPDLKAYLEDEDVLSKDEKKITNEWLWTLFKPGTPVVATTRTGESQILLAHSCFKTSDGKIKNWVLNSWAYDWNGVSFNRVLVQHEFERFQGQKAVNTLPMYPLKYHKNGKVLEDELEERGKSFCELCLKKRKSLAAEYEGMAVIRGEGFRGMNQRLNKSNSDVAADSASSMNTPVSGQGDQLNRKNIRGRVMVDYKAYLDYGPSSSEATPMGGLKTFEPDDDEACSCEDCDRNFRLRMNQKSYYDGCKDTKGFENYQFIMCPARIFGYHLSGKEWVELDINKLKFENGNKDPKGLDVVEMNKSQKRLITDLVQNHTKQPLMRDVIENKGRGLVILFHGPPGVGKTLTAERLARTTGKSLFPVNVSDIGINATEAERNLKTLFELAATWEAIMLFDEADVFLESRGSNNADLQRNALVSVLLRALEYYNGILILTTNRIRTMDVAVQSRINIAIRYKELDKHQKRSIYLNFIKQLSEDQADTQELINWIDNDEHEESPFEKLNGRQIRNVLFSAASLARRRDGNGVLRLEHIREVLRWTDRFQDDVKNIMESARKEAEVGIDR